MLSGAGGALGLGLGLGLGGGVGGAEAGGRGGVASCPVVVPSSSELQLLDKHDLRYYFQHPYPRLFVTYFVIFCNFLLFAEDPISHSHTGAHVDPGHPVRHDPRQAAHPRLPLRHAAATQDVPRRPGFLDDNVPDGDRLSAAACGTWLGDLITALMVTDMMLQDNLYPHWAPRFRQLWRRSNVPRILIFWVGSVVATSVVVTLIVSDWISWDHLNRDFLATTELSRAFLASFILVMDLLIVMQDWDFPHFTTTLHVNLPGFSVATLQWKYAEVDVTGKWFNYGIIFLVMLLDLNMWKNQIFYDPRDFGQYTGPDDKVRTINDPEILEKANASLWTWEVRSQIDVKTNLPYHEQDMQMNSRYMNYPLSVKWTAFIPSGIGLIMFVALVSLYGRFPSNQAHHLADRTHASCRLVKPDKELGDIPAPASR
ncbi:Uncharacterized protein GBIM_12655 [Gryllus bimaculatus]|nr:Uncharacterized protein GBIM_12655 [Gryllus bimaculatus]